MSVLTTYLLQDVTWWQFTGVDGYNEESFATPTVIKGRWEDRNSIVISEEGTEVVSTSRVYLAQDVKVGDYLMLGVSVAADPRQVDAADRVLAFRKIPNLFNTDYERKAML